MQHEPLATVASGNWDVVVDNTCSQVSISSSALSAAGPTRMDDLDPSHRGLKRKRTGSYATRRRTLASSPAQAQGPQPVTTKGATEAEVAEQVVDESDDPTTHFPAVEEPLALESDEQARTPTSRRSSGGRQTSEDRSSDIKASAGTAGRPRGPRKSQNGAKQTARPRDTEEEQPVPVGRRSSGRTRRPARRAGSAVDKLPEQTPSTSLVKNRTATGVLSPQPKGILTPSRRGRGRRNGPRKSVVFHEDVDVDDTDEKQIEDHFGFKDISSSRKKNGSPSTRSISESSRAREEDVFEDATEYQDRARQHGAIGDADDDSISDEYPDTDEIAPTFQPTSKMAQAHSSLMEDENPHLTNIKVQVLSRLISRSQTPDDPARAIPAHLHHQYTTLHSLLSATVTAGESNSLLLLGSRGSGKSFLLENALADLSKSHSDDFHVVRLNGFFQTDDKLALKEIWHQLGREMAVPEDETSEVSSYADTMASLLSLLSHPEELGHSDAMEVDGAYNSREHGPARTSKSVIFIMDEFDRFTTHPRQTLLYNLFDIAQAKKAPIAVIGCSTRMDVVDCLEKRVKSRFSHRWLHIPAVKSLMAFEEIAKDVLCLPVEGKDVLGVAKEERDWRARWKEIIETQFLPSSGVQSMLKTTFSSTKSITDLLAALYVPVATLAVPDNLADQPQAPPPSIMDNTTTTTALPSLLALLPHLPILHLSLLVSAARLETIYDVMIINFTLVHKQYADLLARSRLQRSSLLSFNKAGTLTGACLRTWNKDTARSAWEELALWEFIVPASGGGGRLGDEGLGGDGIVTRMFRVDVTLDEVAWAIKQKLGLTGVGETLYKWCREI
ncbi:hypothetical protein CLCR_08012 [Cladophialophora carrionii]|uniref:Uncharacterized protein n=1 Tax=Cladophialophora carrionii TaxID=86049 RepID=A0A1C1CRC8_9EURO|nr:hypothetical protein CLCR_08012 [Cladophialophora carrionii]